MKVTFRIPGTDAVGLRKRTSLMVHLDEVEADRRQEIRKLINDVRVGDLVFQRGNRLGVVERIDLDAFVFKADVDCTFYPNEELKIYGK